MNQQEHNKPTTKRKTAMCNICQNCEKHQNQIEKEINDAISLAEDFFGPLNDEEKQEIADGVRKNHAPRYNSIAADVFGRN